MVYSYSMQEEIIVICVRQDSFGHHTLQVSKMNSKTNLQYGMLQLSISTVDLLSTGNVIKCMNVSFHCLLTFPS